MKRIGVYVCYDEEGIVDDYKIYLLESLREYLSELIIVVNGFIHENELNKLKNISQNIFIREDIGFDGGAFKDIFTGKYKYINWELWDEVILFNDSFYGPLFSWQEVFKKMEDTNYEFWGFTLNGGYDNAPIHIQSYFIAVQKKMFLDNEWIKFWENLKISSEQYSLDNFENTLTKYFSDREFTYGIYLDKTENEKYLKDSSLIDIYSKLPIVKWRIFSVLRYKQNELLLNYIEKNTDYNVELIKKHLERIDSRIRPFSMHRLDKFLSVYKKGYIFGHGRMGKRIEEICCMKNWELRGFIVSNPKTSEEISIDDIILEKEDGVIVALNFENWQEVQKKIIQKFPMEQLLAPPME